MIKMLFLAICAFTLIGCGGNKGGNGEGAVSQPTTENQLVKCPPNYEKDGYTYHGFGLCKKP